MSDKPVIATIFAIAIFAIGLAGIGLIVADAEEWDEFVEEHECTVTRKVEGQAITGTHVSPAGTVVTSTAVAPGQTCWLCDDGVEYCR